MHVITVQGERESSELGYVLPHEHILIDTRQLVSSYKDVTGNNIFNQKVTMQNLGLLSRNPYAVLDNAVLNEEDVQINEVLEFKKAGGDTIVDVTLPDIGRDHRFLYAVSRLTSLNIIAGCGYYIDATHSPEVDRFTIEQLAEKMLQEITTGIEETNIRAGVIGEIGTGDIITENEYKVLHAASLAQAESGVGMHIHASLLNRNGIDAAKFAVEKGASADKTCINHVDVKLDMEYIKTLLDMGVYIEFDNFGKEYYVDKRYRNLLKGSFATDKERVIAIKHLIDCGYIHQILVSNDICLKTLTHHYGGWGYDHIITNIIPMMRDSGITPEETEIILKRNPAKFLEVIK